MFRSIRIIFLLLLFIVVAFYTQSQRLNSRNWAEPLEVVIYPINADQDDQVAAYIESLDDDDFESIDRFMAEEAEAYELFMEQPVSTNLAAEIDELPPAPPDSGNIPGIIFWSLRLRYWAYTRAQESSLWNNTQVQIFVLYHRPEDQRVLAHSLGLEKGLIGVVHAFSGDRQRGKNNLVIAHELLHTVGATDKYDAQGLPIFPQGFAEPDRQPRYPQSYAELMAGRIAVSPSQAVMPSSLRRCSIGYETAVEINWLQE